MTKPPSRQLETVANPAPQRSYLVRMVAPEFTCLCPRTGQPDFATIVVEYVPGSRLIELKSLKLYLWSWRDEGIFHEAVVNRILDDLAAAAEPIWLQVCGLFRVRGGITTSVTASIGTRPPDTPDAPESATGSDAR
ncbi:MAG: NADPH-dependent 7-cyano-7-deazaguanine reductase QueF [Acidobacteriota bacterium]|nr:MAG: NADPH-dependent 7-cyano-7-deazaguanine reductase QueF [Acidobacteriota bacterium]